MIEPNKIYNMDCVKGMKQISSKSIDLLVTDPPYKLVQGGCTNEAVRLSNNMALTKQGKVFEHNEIEFHEWLPEAHRVLKDSSHCYIMINGRNLAELQIEAEKAGFEYQNLLVWHKGNTTPNKWYLQSCEFILFLRKGEAKNINNMGTQTLLSVPNIKAGTKIHPTEKPINLMKILIGNSSNEGDIVLDPFMGSGSTALACIDINRNYIGFELDPDYYKSSLERLDYMQRQVTLSDWLGDSI